VTLSMGNAPPGNGVLFSSSAHRHQPTLTVSVGPAVAPRSTA
jgi:hypothetical protein